MNGALMALALSNLGGGQQKKPLEKVDAPCFKFAEGKCTFGDRCRFRHDAPAKKSPRSTRTAERQARRQAQKDAAKDDKRDRKDRRRLTNRPEESSSDSETSDSEVEVDFASMKNDSDGKGVKLYEEAEVIDALKEQYTNDSGETLMRWRAIYSEPQCFELWKKIMKRTHQDSKFKGKKLGPGGAQKIVKKLLAVVDEIEPVNIKSKPKKAIDQKLDKTEEGLEKLTGIVTNLAEVIQNQALTPRVGTSGGYRMSPGTPIERRSRKQPKTRAMARRPAASSSSASTRYAVDYGADDDAFAAESEEELLGAEAMEESDDEQDELDALGGAAGGGGAAPVGAVPAMPGAPGGAAVAGGAAPGAQAEDQEISEWLGKFSDHVKARLENFKQDSYAKQTELPANDPIGPECAWMLPHTPVIIDANVLEFLPSADVSLGRWFTKDDYRLAATEALEKVLTTIKPLRSALDRMVAILKLYGIKLKGLKNLRRTLVFTCLVIARNEREKAARASS